MRTGDFRVMSDHLGEPLERRSRVWIHGSTVGEPRPGEPTNRIKDTAERHSDTIQGVCCMSGCLDMPDKRWFTGFV